MADEVFAERIAAILTRYFRQNGHSAPDAATCRGVAERLGAIIQHRGLPRPLRVEELGEPGQMSEAECAPLVEQVLGGESDPLLADAVRQLVKACFYPEFKTCRDSFREVGADGACRRQELNRARRRVSGSHCVDCPYWVALIPTQHEQFLLKHWRTTPAEFDAHRNVFLPEDFRALRQWLYAAARAPQNPK
jgi:hypothetical protein